MLLDRAPVAPSGDNQIDPAPQWKSRFRCRTFPISAGDVFEQSHPERGEGFVIKLTGAAVRGKSANFLTHSVERLVRRQRLEISQRHRNVRGVCELGRGNSELLERIHQCRHLGVAGKVTRLQLTARRVVGLSAQMDEPRPNKEENDRADDRQDEPGRVKSGAWRRLGKEPCDQAANDGAADAEEGGVDKTKVLSTWHDRPRNPTDDKTDDDRPKYV
jgi:hypothetical protein